MKAVLVTILCLLVACIAHALDDPVCPPEDATSPCICNDGRGIGLAGASIRCSGLVQTSALINALKRFAGLRTFHELRIESSVLQYIPHEIFEEVRFKELYVRTSTFIDLFDEPPKSLTTLTRITIEKSTFYRTIWKHLTQFSNLNQLVILDTQVRVIDENFGISLPKSMRFIFFSGTNTRTIKSGAFHGLDNIDVIEITDAELTSVTREVFPTPCNANRLSFKGNKLAKLPKGLFSKMPKLSSVDLRGNELSEIPEDAFEGSQIEILSLNDNPLKCDCGLKWLVSYGPNQIYGMCESPAEMKGKSLREISTDDFEC